MADRETELQTPVSSVAQDNRKPWQFKKGQSGNPGGRKKNVVTLAEQIRALLAQTHPESGKLIGKDKATRLEVLLKRLEVEDPKTLLAYGFGKPLETIDMNIEGADVVVVKHTHEFTASNS